MSEVLLKMNNITKYYSSVKALDNVSLDIKRGEIHAICGENGAGKSTFIKILTGAIEPTNGSIEFEGISYNKLSPKQAMDIGISVIYQEFSLIPYLTVTENVFYGRETHKYGVRNIKEMNKKAKALCDEIGVDLDVNARVSGLSIAYQQIVEILKAISENAKLLIMDEPTAPLTLKETELFFNVVDKLKQKGVTIIFISHRLEEVFQISDRATVFMDGKYIVTKDIDEIDQNELISYMVGRELSDTYPQPKKKPGNVVLKLTGVSNKNVNDINFELKSGEILGFGGLVGAGRTELMRIIYGADKFDSGKMEYKGKAYKPDSPQEALSNGIGLLPEDRKNQGFVPMLSIKDNIVISTLKKHSKLSVINRAKVKSVAEKSVSSLSIKTSNINQKIEELSGGNQQKVILAKILDTKSDVLIFDEPTRGIDVGTKQEIYNLICDLADQGKSIILVSSEMPELIGLSTRIMVMNNGEIVGELAKEEFTQERLFKIASTKIVKEEVNDEK